MDIDRLRQSLKGETYRDLCQFLNLKLEQLRSIDNVQEYSKAQDQAVELKAQKKAFKKLENILSEIITVGSIEEVEKPEGNDYGLDEK
jgi:hypothetical protein